jgi:hypothetical protein
MDRYHNWGYKQPFSEAARIGNWGHAARVRICTGKSNLSEELSEIPVPWMAEALSWVVNEDPLYDHREDMQYEKQVRLSRSGRIVRGTKSTKFMMILDRVGMVDDICEIDDLKFSHPDYQNRDETEIAAYLLAGQKLYPKSKICRFRYVYARSQTVDVVEVPTKEIKELYFQRLLERLEHIEEAEPNPTPGPHCESWFGSGPCQFAGRECPIAVELLPVAVENLTPTRMSTQKILRLPREKAAPQAFMALLHNQLSQEEITPEILSLAYEAGQQITQGNKQVKAAIKAAMSEKNYRIPYGEEWIGLEQQDKLSIAGQSSLANWMALKVMLRDGWPDARIAPYISFNLAKLRNPNPGDEELCRTILEICTEPGPYILKTVTENE